MLFLTTFYYKSINNYTCIITDNYLVVTRLDLVLKSKLLFYFYFIECLYVGVYLIVLLKSSFPDDLPSVANLKTMAIFYKIIFLKT